MKKTFVELYNEWKNLNVDFWHASDFASYLDAQGYKPKKSRWVKFEATTDNVCPVTPNTLVKVKVNTGALYTDDYNYADSFPWKIINGDQCIIAYKVKKEKKK